jgi:hypothetical protein
MIITIREDVKGTGTRDYNLVKVVWIEMRISKPCSAKTVIQEISRNCTETF